MRGWRLMVSAVALLAGVLFATSATTAQGTDLRAGRRLRLAELIDRQQREVAVLDDRARALEAELAAATETAAGRDSRVQAAQAAVEELLGPAGLMPVLGPGVVVTLDDAPRPEPGQSRPGNATPDDLVVHEQDILAVLNALWAGGADAVTVMGDRVVSTSSVRCVGNTLLLHGAVYSPPFRVSAIGDADRLEAALDAAPGVKVFRDYVDAYGLGYRLDRRQEITMPAYDGQLRIAARAARS